MIQLMVAKPSWSHFGYGVSVHPYMMYAKKPGKGHLQECLINSETGQLEPKAFFERWIFHGFCFQLLTNPTLDTTVDMINFALTWLIDLGPL